MTNGIVSKVFNLKCNWWLSSRQWRSPIFRVTRCSVDNYMARDFQRVLVFTWCNFFLVEWDSEKIIVRTMVLTILNEAIILSAICEEKTSKSESYPWILKLSLEQNPTTGTGPRSDCQCASGIPPRVPGNIQPLTKRARYHADIKPQLQRMIWSSWFLRVGW